MYGKKKSPDKTRKLIAGGFLIPAAVQGALGIGQSIFGMSQRKQAKEQLAELRKNAPNLTLPPSLRKLADEPVAEEYMEAQELGAQRRTAQGIDALSRGGSRSLANLPQILESERIGEQQRAGQYEQMRKGALSQLGAAEERLRDLKVGQHQAEVDAARQSLEAGQQNIFGGLGQVGRGAAFLDEDYVGRLFSNPTQMERQEIINLPSKGLPGFKKGGLLKPMKTKGEFSHKTNKKALIDEKTGVKEAELTGSEIVFNKDQYKKMMDLVKKDDKEALASFIKETFSKFESE